MAKKKRLMHPDDLLRMVFVADPRISPNGKTVLFARRHIEENKYITNLWSVGVDGKGLRQWTQEKGAGHGRWSPDGSQIAFISGRKESQPQIHLMPSDGGEARALTSLPEGSLGGFSWSPDGKHLAFLFRPTAAKWTKKEQKKRDEKNLSEPPMEIETLWYRLDGDGYFEQQRFALWVVDAETGEARELYSRGKMGDYSYDWLPDSSGLLVCHSIAKEPLLGKPNDQLHQVPLSGKPKRIPCSLKGHKGSVRISPKGDRVAWLGVHDPEGWGTKNTRLYVMPIGGGEATCLTADDDYDLDSLTLSDTNMGHTSDGGGGGFVRWSKDGKSIYVGPGHHGGVQLAKVNSRKGGLEMVTSGKHCFAPSDFNGEKFVGSWGDATRLNDIAICGKDGKLKRLTDFNAEFYQKVEVVKPSEHWISSTDGAKVHTWVLRPPQRKKGRSAAVLEIHGGPHAQYGWALFHEFQCLVEQGWTVVYSNPRGSKGYGEEFCRAIKGDWGTKDWDDIQAVTAWMQKRPFIDPKRMGVMGGSYGGYMTNWVIGHCNDFKGAITDRCVSNWISMSGNSDFPLNRDQYFGGYAWGDHEKIAELWRQSPLAYFDQVKTPTLIIHSEGDLRCNVEQGDQVFHALQAQGIESKYVRYPKSTSHGMSRGGPPDLRQHRLGQIIAWWRRHLAK